MADPVNKVVDTIPMPGPGNQLAAIGSHLYVTIPTAEGGLTKVDTTSKDVEPSVEWAVGAVVMLDFHRTVPIPDTIEPGPADRRIYVLASSAGATQLVEIIPGRFDSVVKRDLEPSASFFDLVASPTKGVLYLADLGNSCVNVYDPDEEAIVATVRLDGAPQFLTVTEDGRFIYAAAPAQDAVFVIDTAPNPPQVTRRLSSRGSKTDLAVTPDGRRLIVGWDFSTEVGIYDIESETIEGVRVGREPYNVAVNASGTRAYTSNFGTSTVGVVDLTLTPPRAIETIFGFAKPRGMCFSEDGHRLYVANGGPDSFGKYSISVVAV